jgi:hypothetical protein
MHVLQQSADRKQTTAPDSIPRSGAGQFKAKAHTQACPDPGLKQGNVRITETALKTRFKLGHRQSK